MMYSTCGLAVLCSICITSRSRSLATTHTNRSTASHDTSMYTMTYKITT